ncbi:single-stranded-DNA-specific exonuclease RecJ [Methanobrevibacter sp. DSM 116169]|uniref:single-stranded-DNA-specific exonuclease RecJ n=1 Tax=Methanobrevibacter sp. DSM 116169 TaxID=3242727 RepID=UPI0038FD299C
METLPVEMQELYIKAKKIIEESNDIKIYSHNDCDGISSGAILSTILDRLNKPHVIEFVNLDKLNNLELKHELTIFSDLGSGQEVDKLANKNNKIIILDHHPPLRDKDYYKDKDYTYLEINPIHFGIDGSYYVCGGGLCYFLAKEFNYTDLSWIGVLSAIGDMQNTHTGKFEGLNKIILNDSIEEGLVLKHDNDLSLYGRETRPLFVALSYFSDVKLPLTNNRTECIAILKELGIPKEIGSRSTTLSDLTPQDKKKLFSKLFAMLSLELPPKYVKHIPKLIIADSYEFLSEEDHTFLRDASEFSTAMNACGRNNQEEVALQILKGDRFQALDLLEVITKDHRAYLSEQIRNIEKEDSIIELDNIQYFNGEAIKPEVVGTIAGMILSLGNWQKPMLGFTKSDEDHYKISLRCSRLLAYDGIHFGNLVRDISQRLGGNGGGHSVACGAYIPEDKLDDFLDELNNSLKGQL